MKFFQKLQKLDLIWRKVIVFLILIVVGTGLAVMVGKSFQKMIKEFNKEEFLEKLKVPQIKQEIEEVPFGEIEETKRKLEEELRKLEELAEQIPTTTTTTTTTSPE